MPAFQNRERVILGDLTTVFTPPAECTVAVGMCASCDVAWWGQTCGPKGQTLDNEECWPTTTQNAEPHGTPMFGWGFYSPGLECPAGYTTACSAVSGSTSQWKVQFEMEAQETFVGCCPKGFKCDNLNGQTCLMVAKSTALPTMSCGDGSGINSGYTTFPNQYRKDALFYAPMIQLAFKSSDLPQTTTSSSSSSASSTSATTSGQSSSSIAPGTGSDTDSSWHNGPTVIWIDNGADNSNTPSTLSTGAIAGISVAGAALVLLIVGAALFIWRRRRRAQAQAQTAIPDTDSQTSGSDNTTVLPAYSDRGGFPGGGVPGAHGTFVSELEREKAFPHYSAVEVSADGHERVEAPGQGQGHERFEAPGEGQGHVRYEAPGPGQGHERFEAPGEESSPRELYAGQLPQQQVVSVPVGQPPMVDGYYSPLNGAVEMPAHRYA